MSINEVRPYKAIVAYAHQNCGATAKTRVKRTHRRITPTHHALFLQHVSTVGISVDMHSDTQTMVDNFYRATIKRHVVYRSNTNIGVTPKAIEILLEI